MAKDPELAALMATLRRGEPACDRRLGAAPRAWAAAEIAAGRLARDPATGRLFVPAVR